MKKLIAAVGIGAALTTGALAIAPAASASPRSFQMKRLLAATAIGGALLASSLGLAGAANAFPGLGYCPGGGGGYGSFGYCDGPTYPDGSYDHTVAAMGGWMSSRVCPPDPANPAIPLPWVPGQTCAFRK